MVLQWRHNGSDSVTNHLPHDCLFNRWFRRRSKRTSKLRVNGLCAGNSPGTGELPAQMVSNAENVFTVVYSTVYSDADQRKHQSSASLAFVWGIHRDRWIPRTKGQLRGKCFHLMTSSCLSFMCLCSNTLTCVFQLLWTIGAFMLGTVQMID